jgi:hypothetical protein
VELCRVYGGFGEEMDSVFGIRKSEYGMRDKSRRAIRRRPHPQPLPKSKNDWGGEGRKRNIASFNPRPPGGDNTMGRHAGLPLRAFFSRPQGEGLNTIQGAMSDEGNSNRPA